MSDDSVIERPPPWSERVKFSDQGGGFAYVPNTAIVRESVTNEDLLAVAAEGETLVIVDEQPLAGFRQVRGSFDAIRVVAQLRADGIDAQPDHVLFAHGMTCCCGPHPAAPFDPRYMANPLHANPLHANPLHANPLHANPLHANPLHANSADPNGPTRSSVRPADQPSWFPVDASTVAPGTPSVVVLDTGLADANDLPDLLRLAPGVTAPPGSVDVPDLNSDDWLDPVAGHGTFIAGIIERIAPGCTIEVVRVLEWQGDGNESTIVGMIDQIAQRQTPPAFLNLSFGGYVWEQAPMLSAAVLRAQQHAASWSSRRQATTALAGRRFPRRSRASSPSGRSGLTDRRGSRTMGVGSAPAHPESTSSARSSSCSTARKYRAEDATSTAFNRGQPGAAHPSPRRP